MVTLTSLFLSVSINQGLPPGLLESLCFVESRHQVAAVHHDDGGSSSLGVCQIKHKTAVWLGFKGSATDLMKPANNILYAGKYLKYQLKRYKGSFTKAVIAYNMGNTRGLTTTKYQRKVFNKWKGHK